MLTQQIFGRQTYLARILCICLHLSILSNGWMLFASKEDLLSGPSSSPPTLIPLSLAKPSSMDRSVRPYCRTAHCSSIVAPRHSLLCEWSGKKKIPARRVEKHPHQIYRSALPPTTRTHCYIALTSSFLHQTKCRNGC